MRDPLILLIDNGSLEPAATLNLRALASRLSDATGRTVEPVSLLHSSAIASEALGGIPAEILEPALARRLAAGAGHFILIPLFFGPSGALTGYLVEVIQRLQRKHPALNATLAPPVHVGGDDRLAHILADRVRAVLPPGPPPPVVLVDHGSPVRAVAAVRDAVAAGLARALGGAVRTVIPASMERRPGADYDFNEPLLAAALERPEIRGGAVVVAQLFFSPGRHAGPDGDIAKICAKAEARHPGLKVLRTETIGTHPLLVEILSDRLRQTL